MHASHRDESEAAEPSVNSSPTPHFVMLFGLHADVPVSSLYSPFVQLGHVASFASALPSEYPLAAGHAVVDLGLHAVLSLSTSL